MRSGFFYRTKRASVNALVQLFLFTVAASCVYPLLWMVSSSLKTQAKVFDDLSLWPGTFHWKNYTDALVGGAFGLNFLNSVIYTVCVVFGIAVVASLAAYAFSRFSFRGRNLLFYMFMVAMMIPIPGSFVALYVLLNTLHLRNTPAGYILCMINVGLATSIFLLKTFYDKMPRELEDAARIDGCSKLQIWWNVVLPLSKPILAVVVIFNALNVWNEYILALVVFDDRKYMPLQVALQKFQGEFFTNYPLLMAALTITALPVIVLYIVMQKHIIKGVTQAALVG